MGCGASAAVTPAARAETVHVPPATGDREDHLAVPNTGVAVWWMRCFTDENADPLAGKSTGAVCFELVKPATRQLTKCAFVDLPPQLPILISIIVMPSYKLDAVAQVYGCGNKDDVVYSEIGELFKTPEGRLKLAVYCEQDTALVLKLIQNPKVDPLGKDLALSSICGVWPADLMGRGTQNTLRCKLLRVAHTRRFVLPYVAGADLDAEVDPQQQAGDDDSDDDDGDEDEKKDKEEEEDLGYQGMFSAGLGCTRLTSTHTHRRQGAHRVERTLHGPNCSL